MCIGLIEERNRTFGNGSFGISVIVIIGAWF